MAYVSSIVVWVLTYVLQCYLGRYANLNLQNYDYNMFYVISTIMAILTYVFGRIEDLIDLKETYKQGEKDD